jgi:hypothetical protein
MCSQICDIESRIGNLCVAAMFLTGKEKETFCKVIDKFGMSLADKRELLSKFTDQLSVVVGHPLLPPSSFLLPPSSPPTPTSSQLPPPPVTPPPPPSPAVPSLVSTKPPGSPPAPSSPPLSTLLQPQLLSTGETGNQAKKRKMSEPLGLFVSHALHSASLSPDTNLLVPAPGAPVDQDMDMVSSHSAHSLLSSAVDVGVWHTSDHSIEVLPKLTCILRLTANWDARLAQQRRSLLYGIAFTPFI